QLRQQRQDALKSGDQDTANQVQSKIQLLDRHMQALQNGEVPHPFWYQAANMANAEPEKLPFLLRGLPANIAYGALSLPVKIEKLALGVERGLGLKPTEGYPEHIAAAEQGLGEIASRGGTGLLPELERSI